MTQFDWTDDLSVGNDLIDNQHKGVFLLIRSLSESIGSQNASKILDVSIKKLTLHIVDHFNDEEELMTKVGFPLIDAHCVIHQELSLNAACLMEQYKNNELSNAIPLIELLTDFFVYHIKTEDKMFFEWLRTKKTKSLSYSGY